MRWFIAIRYFLSHKRQSLVCIAGVTISVTMFLSMTSMMNGLTDKFITETVESSGHITIKDEPRETRTLILEKVYTNPNALLVTRGVKPRETVKKIQTGVTPLDYSRAYMLLNSAQTLLDKKNVVNEIVIRTDDYRQAEPLAAQIEGMAGYRTEPWQEASANFLKIFKIQSLITYIITAALLIVAAFGVLNILIMAVLERVNDIAILKSFGLSRADISVIYLFQGLVIGVIGATAGVIFGKLAIEGLRRVPVPM